MNELYIFHRALNLGTILKLDPLSWFISSFSEKAIFKYQLVALSECFIFLVLLFIFNRGGKQEVTHKTSKLETALLCSLTLAFIFFLDRSLLVLPFLNSLLLILIADGIIKTCDKLNIKNFIMHIALCSFAIIFGKPFSFLIFLVLLFKNLSTQSNLLKFSYFFLGLLALYISFDNQPIFDYPRDSNVTPYSPLVHAGAVDFGVDNLPFTLPYSTYLMHRQASFLVLLSLSLSLLFFQLKNKQLKKSQTPLLSSLLCGAVLLLDQNLITNLLDVPLIRFLPGLAYLPLPMLIPLLIAIILLDFLKFQERPYKHALAFALCIQIILTYNMPIPEVLALNKESLNSNNLDQKQTPSNYLINEYKGLKISGDTSQYKELDLNGKCIASASPNSVDALKALDSKASTRWSSKGPQKKGDYFELVCNEEIEFDKIEMRLGSNQTDYPRGISVETNKSKILTLQDWLGPIRKTPKGLFHFGPQQEVELAFVDTQKFKEIKLMIEKGDSTFDWSITEIKVYRDASLN